MSTSGRHRPRTCRAALLLSVLLAAPIGCGEVEPAPEGGVAPASSAADPHRDPTLVELSGRRAVLATDLPPEPAGDLLASLDALEDVLDAAFPFLPAPPGPVRTSIVADRARWAQELRAHGAEGQPGALVCARGEVHLLWRREDWEPFGPPFPLEPRCRPLAAAVFRRRLLAAMGPALRPTWLEEGLVQVFVELAAHELGEAEPAERAVMRRLLDAYLPLFLGEPPLLAEVVEAGPEARRRRMSAEASAWAVARHLLSRPGGARVLELALRHHAGLPEPLPRAAPELAPGDWEAARTWLAQEEEPFLRGLQSALLRELLVDLATAPTPVDRWEAAGALRLIANLDIDADLPDPTRQRAVRSGEKLLRETPPPARFLDLFQDEVARAAGAKNRVQATRQVRSLAVRELERRAKGFGHPALELGRLNLLRSIERAVAAAAAQPAPR